MSTTRKTLSRHELRIPHIFLQLEYGMEESKDGKESRYDINQEDDGDKKTRQESQQEAYVRA